jgi:NAD(P)-dependent dehydrogenase (short-subunit alcohol dehydrogenase family)
MNGTILDGRTAVIYGGGGSIGGAVAAEFARQGARVFLAGRTRATLDTVVDAVTAAGGRAEAAVVDALDQAAVEAHLDHVLATAGGVDISFNLVTRGDVQGVPLTAMAPADLLRAVDNGLLSALHTAGGAARRMAAKGSGVILHLNSGSGAGAMPGMGSTGPADAATEAFMRYLAAENGPQGVRVCGIWTAGVAETLTREKLAAVAGDRAPDPQSALDGIAAMSVLRRNVRLADVASTAAFLASDGAAGLTGSMVNVSAGLVLR